MAWAQLGDVERFRELLSTLLHEAQIVKNTDTIEPPLNKSEFGDIQKRIHSINGWSEASATKTTLQFGVIETAVRYVFNELLASENIEQSGFVRVWNLLDLVSFFTDAEQCPRALVFWLVEDLLDSQTIAGCRKVFDYLESRRERITARHFKEKHMVILRTCNELLRRLSRAEDTTFCGRVFIFLFQSFPLGDRSSVNLRGEYHVENVTTYDEIPPRSEGPPETMDVDSNTKEDGTRPATPLGPSSANRTNVDSKPAPKSVTFDPKKSAAVPAASKPDADELYPIFWSLQQSFSQPKRLFDTAHFKNFKKGLESTMAMLEAVQKEQQGRPPSKVTDDGKRGAKRKRGQADDELSNTFNPKYLTSRDLFELEISDLSFRRHIAVQSLIILDFLLSLSPKAREKQATAIPQNKSVVYAEQVLSDEDVKWATETKNSIAEYLKKGFEGPFFHRMVETVLSRDKNWVRWKIENCPSIERPAVTPDEYLAARAAAKKMCSNKRLRPHPMASLDLKFLTDADGVSGMEKLKTPRFLLPALDEFKRTIADDDFEIEMPANDEAKEQAITSKASKSWRALRIASKSKLAIFDKIDDPERIDIIFEDSSIEPVMDHEQDTGELEEVTLPTDSRPVIISGPSGAGKGTLVQMLLEKHPKVFGLKPSHTTRAPREGEVNGVHYHFVSKEAYDVMRDGDQFLELNNFNGNDYGTSRKIVEGIVAAGKVPIMEMDYHGIQQLKDQNYSARFIFITAPSTEELENRLRGRGKDTDEKIKERLLIAEEEIKHAETEGFHDTKIINDDLASAYTSLEGFIFDPPADSEMATNGVVDETAPEVTMEDA